MKLCYSFDLKRKPAISLHNVDFSLIGKLIYHNLKGNIRLNQYSELSFDVPYDYRDPISFQKYVNPYYKYLEGLRYLYVEGMGYFQIQTPAISSDGVKEIKSITAYSAEYDLTHKFIHNLKINTTDTSNNAYQSENLPLYNLSDPKRSVLGLTLLEKTTDWKIGHIDEKLFSIKRSFDIAKSSVYDFLTNDVASSYNCIVLFDIMNFKVNFYDADCFGEDTHLRLDFNNLVKNADVDYSQSDICTSLRVSGSDDAFDISSINNGNSYITDLGPYISKDWMGANLYEKYKTYLSLYQRYSNIYIELGKYIEAFQARKTGLQNNAPIDDDYVDFVVFDSEKFIEYGLNYLENKIELAKTRFESALFGISDETVKNASNIYNNYIVAYTRKKEEIKNTENVITQLMTLQKRISQVLTIKHFNAYDNNRSSIFTSSDFVYDSVFDNIYDDSRFYSTMQHTANFGVIYGDIKYGTRITMFHEDDTATQDNYTLTFPNKLLNSFIKKALAGQDLSHEIDALAPLLEYSYFSRQEEATVNKLIIEGDYTDSNFYSYKDENVTLKRKYELKNIAETEIKKINNPTLNFSAELANPFIMETFKPLIEAGVLCIGNYVNIFIRPDYGLTVYLQEMHINFEDLTDFSFSFSNIKPYQAKSFKRSDVLKELSSVSNAVSLQNSYNNQLSDNVINLSSAWTDGFKNATDKLRYSSDSEENHIYWDKSGFHVAENNNQNADFHSIDFSDASISFNQYHNDNIYNYGALTFGEIGGSHRTYRGMLFHLNPSAKNEYEYCGGDFIAFGSELKGNLIDNSNSKDFHDNKIKLLVNANKDDVTNEYGAYSVYADSLCVINDCIIKGSFSNASLESLKENITPVEHALDLVANSQIYQYHLKSNPDETEYGLIIGEEYQTPKELINKNGDGVKLYSMLSMAWAAIKELNEKLENNKERRLLWEKSC